MYDKDPVRKLNLSTRTLNVLKREGVVTMGQLLDLTVREILDMQKAGLGVLADIIETTGEVSERDDILRRLDQLEHDMEMLGRSVAEL